MGSEIMNELRVSRFKSLFLKEIVCKLVSCSLIKLNNSK